MLTCGIDPSFSNTGIAVVNEKLEIVDWNEFSFPSKIGAFDRIDLRSKNIADSIIEFINKQNTNNFSVFIEIPLGTLYGYANNLRVVFWFLVYFIENAFPNIDLYAVPQATLTKWVVGTSRAGSDRKAAAFLSKYSSILPQELREQKRKNRDVWDAIALAIIGQQLINNVFTEIYQIDIGKNIKKL